jgi:hypothetical protein
MMPGERGATLDDWETVVSLVPPRRLAVCCPSVDAKEGAVVGVAAGGPDLVKASRADWASRSWGKTQWREEMVQGPQTGCFSSHFLCLLRHVKLSR